MYLISTRDTGKVRRLFTRCIKKNPLSVIRQDHDGERTALALSELDFVALVEDARSMSDNVTVTHFTFRDGSAVSMWKQTELDSPEWYYVVSTDANCL